MVTDTCIAFSTQLAAGIGLEAAVLLNVLRQSCGYLDTELQDNFEWYQLDKQPLLAAVPFWNDRDCQRILDSLSAQGILLIASPPLTGSDYLRFAFNHSWRLRAQPESQPLIRGAPQSSRVLPPLAKPGPNRPQGAQKGNLIDPNWTPSRSCIARLAQQGITDGFARDQVDEFVNFWREEGVSKLSWDNTFIERCVKQWRIYEASQERDRQAKQGINYQFQIKGNPKVPIEFGWQPSDETVQLLYEKVMISLKFIEDCVPEFIIYWKGRGEQSNTWDSRFVSHVKRQWELLKQGGQEVVPRPIKEDWQPSQLFFNVLEFTYIDPQFAKGLVNEFILYWLDRGAFRHSWDSVFLFYTKLKWSQVENRTTREIRLEEELTDTSWAD